MFFTKKKKKAPWKKEIKVFEYVEGHNGLRPKRTGRSTYISKSEAAKVLKRFGWEGVLADIPLDRIKTIMQFDIQVANEAYKEFSYREESKAA